MVTLCIVSKNQPEALRLALSSATENAEISKKLLRATVWVNTSDEEDAAATRAACLDIPGLQVFALGHETDVYAAYNALARVSTTRLLVFANDDMVFGPGWLMPLASSATRDTWVSPILVEPGVVDVASLNVLQDFGRSPKTFRRQEFEAFVLKHRRSETTPLGWFQPVCLDRWRFLELCGYPTTKPFPAPNDLEFFRGLPAVGVKHIRHYSSWVYHFQRLGQIERDTDGDRSTCDPAPEHAGDTQPVH